MFGEHRLIVDEGLIRTARLLLRPWLPRGQVPERASGDPCQGQWVIELPESGEVVGGTWLLPLPPDELDLRIGWQLAPKARGRGFEAEAGHAVAHHAFGEGLDEVFAVVPPGDAGEAATARRIGMEWVGTTEKYYQRPLEVYRLRRGDLDVPALSAAPADARARPSTVRVTDPHAVLSSFPRLPDDRGSGIAFGERRETS